MTDAGALEFVARMTDQASGPAEALHRTLNSLGGPVQEITAAVQVHADGIAQAVGDVTAGADQAVAATHTAGTDAGQALVTGIGQAEGAAAAAGQDVGQAAGEQAAQGTEDAAEGIDLVPIFAAAGAAAGAVLVASIATAMENDKVNDRLAGQLRLTEAESATAGEVAGALYAGAYGENLGEVNDAVGAVISSIDGMRGASEADLQGLTANALDFADAFEVDVARASQVAGQLLRTGLAKDGQEAFDLLTTASQQVPVNVREDVLDAADEYGQFFATLGYNGREAFAMIVDAADKGQFGIDKIGDAVKEFTIRSTDMSTASRDAYASMGLDAEAYENRILAGGDSARQATGEIIAALQTVDDPATQAANAIALFGTPLEDLNVSEIPAFLDALSGAGGELENVAGATDDLGTTLADNASTNIESFKRQISTAFVDYVGGKALPVVEDLAGSLAQNLGPALSAAADAGEAVISWARDNEGVVKALAVVIGALTAVTVAHTLVMAVQSGALAAWVLQLGIVRAATAVWAAIQWVLNGALAANPIGLVVVAIAALIAAIVYLWKNNEGFRNFIIGAWEAISSGVGAAVEWVKNAAVTAWEWIRENIVDRVTAIAHGVRLAFLAVVMWVVQSIAQARAVVVAGWEWIKTNVIDRVVGIASAIRAGFLRAAEWVRDQIDRVKFLIQAGWAIAKGYVTDAINRIVSTIAGAVSSVRAKIDQVVAAITGPIRNVISTVTTYGRNIIDGIVSGITGAIQRVKDAAKRVADAVTGPVKNLLGINSPSKVFAQYGAWTGEGLANGLLDQRSDVAAAASSLAGAVTAGAAPALDLTLPQIIPPPQSVSMSGQVREQQLYTIRHEVSFTDAEVAAKLDAEQIAAMLAADPRAGSALARTLEARTARRPLVTGS